jgi:hypothetical protein
MEETIKTTEKPEKNYLRIIKNKIANYEKFKRFGNIGFYRGERE